MQRSASLLRRHCQHCRGCWQCMGSLVTSRSCYLNIFSESRNILQDAKRLDKKAAFRAHSDSFWKKPCSLFSLYLPLRFLLRRPSSVQPCLQPQRDGLKSAWHEVKRSQSRRFTWLSLEIHGLRVSQGLGSFRCNRAALGRRKGVRDTGSLAVYARPCNGYRSCNGYYWPQWWWSWWWWNQQIVFAVWETLSKKAKGHWHACGAFCNARTVDLCCLCTTPRSMACHNSTTLRPHWEWNVISPWLCAKNVECSNSFFCRWIVSSWSSLLL